jgi:tRNA(Ile)-lysidine synthase
MDAPLQAALEVLARRLDPRARAPLAVAVSGGGDSLALLLAARTFADHSGRTLVVLHVDHRLQASSGDWAVAAAKAAAGLGAGFRRLDWLGDKPNAGLPAAARQARHRLIADAARQMGARVVLLGHTLDDQLENALMRAEGAPVGPLRQWTPSPVWPQGRGLFLCRPLLAARRADLRRLLASRGLDWIEDPANADARHARVRARAAVARGERGAMTPIADIRVLAQACRALPWGGIEIDRAVLLDAPAPQALRLLQIALASAAGVESLARPARAGALLARLAVGETFVSTLGGARVQAARTVLIGREAGEAARGGLGPLNPRPGTSEVWDGRFAIEAPEPGWTAQALRGLAARLAPGERARLREIPAWARLSLPVWRRRDDPSAPLRLALGGPDAHIDGNGLRCRALCQERFAAAAGLVSNEVEIGTFARMANVPRPSYVGAGQ